MKIRIDGTNTNNKGAELMLYAILEEIELKYPQAIVYYNPNNYYAHTPIQTKLRLKQKSGTRYYKKLNAILRRLNISTSYFTPRHASKNIDLVLDGGGFQFSDQFVYSEQVLNSWEDYYKELKSNGTKIILLSQAFGPFENERSKRTISLINDYVDVVIAREGTSNDYLLKAGINPAKLWLYSDFTLAVSGTIPHRYQSLAGKVCIIPNKKMISHGNTNATKYLAFYKNILSHLKTLNLEVFLLNHEGQGDLQLCKDINSGLDTPLTIVSNLNAKEVKGIIGNSRLVISSRYHGVASALNQGVPCLATSWSHKYALLYKDFGLTDMIMDLDFSVEALNAKLNEALDDGNSKAYRNVVDTNKKRLLASTQEMWNKVWQSSGLD